MISNCGQTLKGLGVGEPFQGSMTILCSEPRVVAALQPWAEISERLRRNTNAFGVI